MVKCVGSGLKKANDSPEFSLPGSTDSCAKMCQMLAATRYPNSCKILSDLPYLHIWYDCIISNTVCRWHTSFRKSFPTAPRHLTPGRLRTETNPGRAELIAWIQKCSRKLISGISIRSSKVTRSHPSLRAVRNGVWSPQSIPSFLAIWQRIFPRSQANTQSRKYEAKWLNGLSNASQAFGVDLGQTF